MKSTIQFILQKLLGLEHYLFIFSWYKIKTLKRDKGENDFFHFLKYIHEGDTVLDIGANIGIMSYYLSKKTGRGRVYSFEPIPVNINALRRIVSHFKLLNVRVMDMALGNYNGEVEMVLPVVKRVAKQGLSHVVIDEIGTFNEGQHYKAKIQTLDQLSRITEHTINAIKIDVENFEFRVLEGAKETLARDKPIIYCELWDNENRRRCFEFLTELGYKILIKIDSELVPFDSAGHTTQNFFFIAD